MHAVFGYDCRVAIDRPQPRDAQVEIVILRHAKTRIEAAHLGKDASPEEHRRDHFDEIALQQRFEMVIHRGYLDRASQVGAIGRDKHVIAHGQSAIRVRVEGPNAARNGLRLQPVIRVEKEKIAPPAFANSRIARSTKAAIFLAQIAHRQAPGNCPAAVG